MPPPASAIVIGNGLVGLACALAIRRRGVTTTIVAPDEPWRGASWGNAGHIATEQVEPLASIETLLGLPRRLFMFGGPVSLPPRASATWLPFALRLIRASTPTRVASGRTALKTLMEEALPAWRRTLADAGVPELLREDGHLVVWERASSVVRGMTRWRAADLGSACFEDVPASSIAQLQSLIRVPIAGGIRFRGTGQITDLTALNTALHDRFRALGGQVRHARAVRVAGEQGAEVTLEDGTLLSADLALVAAGAASPPLLAPLGLTVPLIAERGYHIQSAATNWPTDMPAVVFEDRSMIVTRFAHGLRAASFLEFADIQHPPDARKWRWLRANAEMLGLDMREPICEWMGARPTLPDYLPAIGRVAGSPAIAYAFGHQHLGLTLAAATGEAIAALICNEAPAVSLLPFDLARFG